MAEPDTVVRVGLEVVLDSGHDSLRGIRAGLITNPSGITRDFTSTIDALSSQTDIELVCLFGPEHGVRGEAQAGIAIASATDTRSGLPIHSLYGATHRPARDILGDLDLMIFDIQDIGVRYATYLSTMMYAQEACVDAGVGFMILDRPNPLGGVLVDGGKLDATSSSFVGAYPLPVLHGMTIGELARMIAAERGWPAPTVIPMHGWQRWMWYDQTGLPWVLPSPNLPTLDAVMLYPGTCLLEGTNLSEGRGTTRPFEIIGAPWIDPFALLDALTERDLPGLAFRPVWFTPTFSKHAGAACGGVQIYAKDRSVVRPAAFGLHLLAVVRQLAPDQFSWIRGENGTPFIDLLLGSADPRQALDGGTNAEQLIDQWKAAHQEFTARRQPFLLYDDATKENNGSN